MNDLIARYRSVAEEARKRFGIIITPFTTRPLSDIFDLAIRYLLPFESEGEGKGLQDAVILSSVLEHLAGHPQLAAAFVTEDTVFPKVPLDWLMQGCPKERLTILTLDNAFDALYDRYFDEQIKRPWEEERHRAKEAVEAILPELSAFIGSHFSESALANEFQGFAAWIKKLIEFRGIGKVDVFYVQTPKPDPLAPNRHLTIAISLRAEYHALVERSFPLWLNLPFSSSKPEQVEETLSWIGGVEATADVEGKRYRNIQFVSLISTDQLGDEKYLGIAKRT